MPNDILPYEEQQMKWEMKNMRKNVNKKRKSWDYPRFIVVLFDYLLRYFVMLKI